METAGILGPRVNMDLLEKISHEDKELLKGSWSVLEKNINDTAYCIFDMIFNQSPDTKQLFPFMKIRKAGDTKRSREMEFHGLRFMQVLESVITAIDNPATLDPLCDNLGRVHGRLTDSRGFKAHHWGVFIECTLFHFRRVLGSEYERVVIIETRRYTSAYQK
ncbi:globin [Teladorsagia circumcincta]|uniref:Globin n=1 Tax=Teladorsagia circumcincta TaxID=45464 RepID=A0A2G9UCS8_TELCI|nr:globin [Teladorsagia circumcincta]